MLVALQTRWLERSFRKINSMPAIIKNKGNAGLGGWLNFFLVQAID